MNILKKKVNLKKTIRDYKAKIGTLLEKYAQAHEKLVVYNHAQWLAKRAAVTVGYMAWDSASSYLASLRVIVNDDEKYVKEASKFELNSMGKPIPYK